MRATRLLIKLTIYYAVIGIAVFAAIKIWPAITGWLPIGGVEQLITQPSKNPLHATEAVRAAHVSNLGQSLFWLTVAVIGALLTSLPVSWVYMGIRNDEEYDQSLINTILVLPMVVTGIVIIVQNSLALAFSLAGIAGAVRFRNSLKSSGDALFILLAVAIGRGFLFCTRLEPGRGFERCQELRAAGAHLRGGGSSSGVVDAIAAVEALPHVGDVELAGRGRIRRVHEPRKIEVIRDRHD